MPALKSLLTNLPEVRAPLQKRLSFKQKLKWTLIILISFFVLSIIPLYGLGDAPLAQFEQLSIILGAQFGSLMSLGIGPIVTASIVLQLLTGSGILKIDLTSHDGRTFFQGLQKILAFFFVVFEAIIYVKMGGLQPAAGISPWILISQLIVGGILIIFMDEVITKWGFGQGVSLFIAAGVSSQIVIRALSPLTTTGTFASIFSPKGDAPVGMVWVLARSILGADPTGALRAVSAILATVLVFVLAVYAQAMKVEIPLSFGRIRGHGIRWPLRFIYTSNIPVILVAALIANVQLWARLLQNRVAETGFLAWVSQHIFGQFAGNNLPVSGLVYWTYSPNLVELAIVRAITPTVLLQSLTYILFMIVGAVIFSIFWVQTSGMDARSQAHQIMSSGLSIPGFRRDERVLERILKRYIFPLTIMGAITVGFLAALADLTGALSRGTGILLTVMIIYKLYEEIAQQHMMDMHPALRKMMEG